MFCDADRSGQSGVFIVIHDQTATTVDFATLFVSLELSLAKWLATSLSTGCRKLSKPVITGGDGKALLDLLARLGNKAEQRMGSPIKVVALHEVGLGRNADTHADGIQARAIARLLHGDRTEPEFAGFLWLEGFYRRFNNHRQLPAHVGFAPSPWRSGKINHDQGIAKLLIALWRYVVEDVVPEGAVFKPA